MDIQFKLNDTSNIERIKIICNEVLSDIAPEELILADQVVEIFVAQPIEVARDLNNADNYNIDMPLGFSGDGELYVTIIVPIIISVLSKMITSFSDEKLKQAVNVIQSGKTKKDLEVETKVNEIKKEITIRLSSRNLTRKKATILTNRILRVIADELSK